MPTGTPHRREFALSGRDRADMANPSYNRLMLGPVRHRKWREPALKEIKEAGWIVLREMERIVQPGDGRTERVYWFKVEREGWREEK